MSDMYGLFNYNTEQDETRALFGAYKTHADSFWYAANNGMIGSAMCFRVQPWEYEVMMTEANYKPTVLAVPPSTDLASTKEEEVSESGKLQQSANKVAISLSVLNRPQTMFLSPPVVPVDQASQKRYVCIYAIHAQSPLLVDVPVFVNVYDRAAHDSVIGAVNRILLANALTTEKKPVIDVLDYFEKVSLLRLGERRFQTLSTIYPVFGVSPKKKKEEALDAPYGASDKTAGEGLDAFSKKVKKAFADVKKYFDEKFEDDDVTRPEKKKDKRHKVVKVKCTEDSVGSKYCGAKTSKTIKKSKSTLKAARLVNTSETTPFKAAYAKGLREAMKSGLCALVANFISKIDGKLSVTTFDLKKTAVKIRLDEIADRLFINSLGRSDVESLGAGMLLVTTTFDKVLKYYVDFSVLQYPTAAKRSVKMAILNGIDMFAKLKNVALRDANNPESRIKYSAILHGAFETIVFKKIRTLVQTWIIDSLKNYQRIDDPAKMAAEKEKMAIFLAEIRLLRSRMKPTFLMIKRESQLTKDKLSAASASFKRYEGAVKTFAKQVQASKKTTNPRYDTHLNDFLIESSEFVAVLDNLSSEGISQEVDNKRSALIRDILQAENTAKTLFGVKSCVNLCEKEIRDALCEKFDSHITTTAISSMFDYFTGSEPLDTDQRIVDYVSRLEGKDKVRANSPAPAAVRLGDSSEWLDDDEEDDYKEDEVLALVAEKLANKKDVSKAAYPPNENATTEANWFENEVLF